MNKKFAYTVIGVLWLLLAILLLGSIITLSIPGNTNVPSQYPVTWATNQNGWQMIKERGVWYFIHTIWKPNLMSWWYSQKKGVVSFLQIVSIMTVLLVCVVPLWFIIINIVTWHFLTAVNYPKTLTYCSAKKDYKKSCKAVKKYVKKSTIRLEKKIITQKNYNDSLKFLKKDQATKKSQFHKAKMLYDEFKLIKSHNLTWFAKIWLLTPGKINTLVKKVFKK